MATRFETPSRQKSTFRWKAWSFVQPTRIQCRVCPMNARAPFPFLAGLDFLTLCFAGGLRLPLCRSTAAKRVEFRTKSKTMRRNDCLERCLTPPRSFSEARVDPSHSGSTAKRQVPVFEGNSESCGTLRIRGIVSSCLDFWRGCRL